MSTFTIHKGDTSPAIEAVLRNNDSSPRDLREASVEFRMTNRSGEDVISSGAGIVDAIAGVVAYEWKSGETDVSGVYRASFTAIFPDGSIETFPNSGSIRVHVSSGAGG